LRRMCCCKACRGWKGNLSWAVLDEGAALVDGLGKVAVQGERVFKTWGREDWGLLFETEELVFHGLSWLEIMWTESWKLWLAEVKPGGILDGDGYVWGGCFVVKPVGDERGILAGLFLIGNNGDWTWKLWLAAGSLLGGI
jgi:hypothetical protein